MADERFGMTGTEKLLVFVPLIALCGYALLFATGIVRPGPPHDNIVADSVFVYTAPGPNATTECEAYPPVQAVGMGDTIVFNSLEGNATYQYTVAFNTVSPLVEPGPYVSGTQYHVNTGTVGKYFGYTPSNGKNCGAPTELIGIIVTH
jgi:hypothetical protein